MNKLHNFETRQILILTLIVSIFLQGCMAFNVSPIGLGETITGLQAAVNGNAGTVAYMKEGSNLVFLGWPAGTNYAWMILDKSGNIQDILKNVCGQKACPEIASELIQWLESNGYLPVGAGALPPAIVETVKHFSYLLAIGSSLPTIPVLFIPVIDPMDLIQPQTGV